MAAAGTKALAPCGAQEKEGSPLWAASSVIITLGYKDTQLESVELTFIWGKMRRAAWEQHLRQL